MKRCHLLKITSSQSAHSPISLYSVFTWRKTPITKSPRGDCSHVSCNVNTDLLTPVNQPPEHEVTYRTYANNWITPPAVLSLSPSQLLKPLCIIYCIRLSHVKHCALMSVCVHEHICATSCVYFDNGACFIASLPQLSKSESPLTPAVRGSMREIICSTHTHRSTPADRTVKREEIEEDVEQRKEQIGCRSREEWGLAKPRRSAL